MSDHGKYVVLTDSLSDPVIESDLFSEEIVTEYLKYQRDPVIGTQTGRVKFSDEGSYWAMHSSLPIDISIAKTPSDPPIDWLTVDERESQGNALWKYSAGYLPTFYEVSQDYSAVVMILDSLWAYTKTKDWAVRSEWMTSLDHALATRIRSLATLLFLFQEAEVEVPASLVALVRSDAANLVRGRESFFPANNHGAMAAVSLIHAAVIFPNVREDLLKLGAEDPLDVGIAELDEVLASIFNDSGLAAENSPEYQRFWITLLEPVSRFFDLFGEPSSSFTQAGDHLEELLVKAREVFHQFLDGAGRMIPIGDTHPRYISGFTTPVEFKGVYEDLGFAIYKTAETTLTFNCGSTNYAHKHCDDTSITLGFKGENIILDSGYYSHDWNDPKAIFTKSQNAHSGLFVRALDNLHPGKVHFPGRERVRARMKSLSHEDWDVVGTVTVDDTIQLERRIQARNDRAFDILDRVEGDGSDFGGVVARYILPQGREVSVGDNSLWIDLEDFALEVTFIGQQRNQIQFVSSQLEPHLKGWISPELNQLEPAVCVEVPFDGISTLQTQLRIL